MGYIGVVQGLHKVKQELHGVIKGFIVYNYKGL